MTTDAQRRANRANAKRSTGPRSAAGKARSSRNAVTHGVFSSDVLISKGDGKEDAGELAALRDRLLLDLQPAGALEEILVDRLVILIWRWRRLLRYETGMTQAAIDSAVADWSKRQREMSVMRRRIQALVGPLPGKSLPGIDVWKETRQLSWDVAAAEGYVIALEPPDPLVDPSERLAWALDAVLADEGRDARAVLGIARDEDIFDVLDDMPEARLKVLAGAVRRTDECADECWERLRCWAALRVRVSQTALDDRLRQEERLRLSASIPQAVSDRVIRYETHISREFARTLDRLHR